MYAVFFISNSSIFSDTEIQRERGLIMVILEFISLHESPTRGKCSDVYVLNQIEVKVRLQFLYFMEKRYGSKRKCWIHGKSKNNLDIIEAEF